MRTTVATRGKWVRAEPVAALYEQGRVRHAARLPELEDEMCDFGADGLSGGRSPDRVDALVWAITELLIAGRGSPRVRAIGQ
jgi:phage terminase large subunit-like protein